MDDDKSKTQAKGQAGNESTEMSLHQKLSALELQGPSYEPDKHTLSMESKFFAVVIIAAQLVFCVLFGVWFDYDLEKIGHQLELYPYFRDVLIMVVFGFGYLMSFLRRYGFTAVKSTFMVTVFTAQFSLLLGAFFKTINSDELSFGNKYFVSLDDLIESLFCAATALIALGGILGKYTMSQLTALVTVVPIAFWLNAYVVVMKLECHDVGGGMTIHTLGSAIGITACYFLTHEDTREHPSRSSNYSSDLASLAGTIFLWVLWPSFNAAVAPPAGQLIAIANTFISLCGSTMATLITSRIFSQRKFEVVHIQNSILAGGVAMGTAGDLPITLAGAACTGFVTGVISTLGYIYMTPFMSHRLNLQDICGITNLHFVPGVISAIVAAIAVAALNSSTEFPHGGAQAGFQVAGLCVSIGFGVVAGLVIGVVMKYAMRPMNWMQRVDYFNDRPHFHIPSDYDVLFDPEAEKRMAEPSVHAETRCYELMEQDDELRKVSVEV
eukprot:CAMPEP_0174890206 /NCGR_PEP_ID=MMETSP0167-20121228/5375_1 /TAXON_ID=38298 /ORGANISM="Rhodella maculata, Strain CCMP736" /LENGTH=495 /DNA_ID=CAMNT_0016127915 /DNA_START=370 /DNA_END=1857 /DNA_ORIENTATION=-